MPVQQVEAGPSEVVTFIAVVDNPSERSVDAEVNVTVPEGWQLVLPPGPIRLSPGEARSIPLPIVLPPHPLAGEHGVIVQVTAGVVVNVRTFVVDVPAVRNLDATVEQAPENTLPESYEVIFRVANRGNVTESLELSVLSNRGIALRAEPAVLQLAPGESAPVSVVVPAIGNLVRPATHSVSLIVAPQGGEEFVRAQARTDVIAVAQPQRLAYHTYPIELSMRVSAASGLLDTGLQLSLEQLEASGRGELQEGGPFVGFRVRYGASDSLRHFEFTLAGADYRMLFGEQRQILGRLLPAASGFGVSIASVGRAGFASIYGLVDDGEPRGGFSAGPLPLWGGDLLLRGTFGPNLAAVSARGEFAERLEDDTLVELEIEPALDVMTGSPAIDSRISARGEAFSVRGSLEYRSPGFLERTSARTRFQTSANFDLLPGLELTGQFDGEMRPSYLRTRLGIGLLGSEGNVRWSVRYQVESRTMGSVRLDVTTLAVAGVILPVDGIAFGGSATWRNIGYSADTPGQDEISVQLVASSQEEHGQVLTEFGAAYDIGGGQITDATLGVVWRGDLNDAAAAEFRLGLDVAGNPGMRLRANAVHELPSDARLAADVDIRLLASGQTSLIASLDVTIPIELYLSKREGVSAVGGWIRNESGAGIPGLVLFLAGFSTLTGPDGTFVFPAIPEGEHLLFVQGLDDSLITVPRLPLTITAPAMATIQISVIPGAIVRGQVGIEDVASNEGAAAGGVVIGEQGAGGPSVRGLRIVFEGGGETLTTLTHPDGHFELRGIVPGTWTVYIDPATVPAGYRVSPAEVEVVTTPGSLGEIEFELQPVRREIRFMGGGSLGCIPRPPLRFFCGPDSSSGPANFE